MVGLFINGFKLQISLQLDDSHCFTVVIDPQWRGLDVTRWKGWPKSPNQFTGTSQKSRVLVWINPVG